MSTTGLMVLALAGVSLPKQFNREAIKQRLLKKEIPIRPLVTKEYPTLAARPAYSVLDRSKALNEMGMQPTDWQQELRLVIKRIANETEK